MHQLENFLLLGVIVTSALAILVVWLLVRRAMHPLEQLASTASEIAATKDHSRRLFPGKSTDEISRLAHTMNGML